jgi:hypothetical protein
MRERLCLLEEPCGPFLKALLHPDCLQLRHVGSSLPFPPPLTNRRLLLFLPSLS